MDFFSRVAQAKIDGQRATVTFEIGDTIEGAAFPLVEDVYSVSSNRACRWFVVHSSPNCDDKACASLREHGFKAFQPQVQSWAVEHRKKVVRIRPLFPRYSFVGLPVCEDGSIDTYTPRKCRGVSDLVRSGGRAITISEETVGDLMLADERGWFDLTQDKAFRNSAHGLVKSGEFGPAMEKIIAAAPDSRMRLFLTYFGKPSGCANRYSAM